MPSLVGTPGDDEYFIELDSGLTIINETYGEGVDKIVIDALPSQVYLWTFFNPIGVPPSLTASAELTISVLGTNTDVTIRSTEAFPVDAHLRVELIEFRDGSVIDLRDGLFLRSIGFSNVFGIGGSDLNDVIFGLNGESVSGVGGDDVLLPGIGFVELYGGQGKDIFKYTTFDISGDTIFDFVRGEDLIDVSGLGFTGIQNGAPGGSVLGYSNGRITNVNGDFNVSVASFNQLDDSDFIFDPYPNNDFDDFYFNTPGADRFLGGYNFDTVSYENASSGVVLSQSFQITGGAAAGDQLFAIDQVILSNHSDTFWGNNSNVVVNGLAGNDFITGGGGNDTIDGGAGDDVVTGGTVELEELYFAIENFSIDQGWTSFDQFPRLMGDIDGDGDDDIVGFGANTTLSSLSLINVVGSSFDYTPPISAIDNFSNAQGWSSYDSFPRLLGDVDGDGNEDIVGFGANTTFVSLSNGEGTFRPIEVGINDFAQAQGWSSFEDFPRLLGDVDGDGYADIVGFGANTTFTALSNGDGTFAPVQSGINNFAQAQGWASNDSFPRLLGDFDGDGYEDILGFGANTTFVALSNGDGTFAPATPALNNFSTAQGWATYDLFPRNVGDFDGDGNDDIIGYGSNATFVAVSNGDGTFRSPAPITSSFSVSLGWPSFDNSPRTVADINGDGVDDLVGFGQFGLLTHETKSYTPFLKGIFDLDTFVFSSDNFGNDTITDFLDGADVIDLSATSYQYSDISIYSFNGGADTYIDAPGNNSITLTGVSSGLINQDDFIF